MTAPPSRAAKNRVDQAPEPLLAGAGRADITDYDAGPVNDPLFAKALVITRGETTLVIATVDAVAVGEIGSITNDYLPAVRARLQTELGIAPEHVLINASHCHGSVCGEVEDRTLEAVKQAWDTRTPVRAGAGRGCEGRVAENRRLRLRDGSERDSRHAYSLPPDESIVGVGPIDPDIGLLRLDREDGRPLAVVFTYACHPIQGVPGGGNTADLVGFASAVLERNLEGSPTALFLQGCAGDINPVGYKDIHHPRNAEPLGTRLGLSALQAVRTIRCQGNVPLQVVNQTLHLPRADLRPVVEAVEAEISELLASLRGTTLNLKSFLQLTLKHGLFSPYPSADAPAYLSQRRRGREDLTDLDARQREQLSRYRRNVYRMEELTRLQENLRLLRLHQRRNETAGAATLPAEVMGVRIGNFALVTFPGELSVEIGLNIKHASPLPYTFVCGCTNGYLYYAPTAAQLQNRGHAQEDSDCLLAPEWQALFETCAGEILSRLR